MDGIGIRPAMLEIGERLATYGYFVLLPDLFYRSGAYAAMNAQTVFTDPEQRQVLMERFTSKGHAAGAHVRHRGVPGISRERARGASRRRGDDGLLHRRRGVYARVPRASLRMTGRVALL